MSFFEGTMEIEPLSPNSATYFSLPLMKSADILFCEGCRSTLAARPDPSRFPVSCQEQRPDCVCGAMSVSTLPLYSGRERATRGEVTMPFAKNVEGAKLSCDWRRSAEAFVR